jgi:hypothetical protein
MGRPEERASRLLLEKFQNHHCTRLARNARKRANLIDFVGESFHQDSLAERSEFELAVPIFEQPDDSWLFRSPTP